jgi:hypothetical protein
MWEKPISPERHDLPLEGDTKHYTYPNHPEIVLTVYFPFKLDPEQEAQALKTVSEAFRRRYLSASKGIPLVNGEWHSVLDALEGALNQG